MFRPSIFFRITSFDHTKNPFKIDEVSIGEAKLPLKFIWLALVIFWAFVFGATLALLSENFISRKKVIKMHKKFQNTGKQKIIAIIITLLQINLAAHEMYFDNRSSTDMKPLFGEIYT